MSETAKTKNNTSLPEKVGKFVKDHPYATAAAVAGGAAAAGGAFYARNKSAKVAAEGLESLDAEIEDEIEAGAISY